jgi:hypothetical protein
MPPPPPAEEPIVRPKAIDSAFQAVLVAIAISALGTVFTFLLDKTQLTSMVTDMRATLPPEQRLSVSTMVGIMQATLGFSILIFVGLFVLFAVKMRAGRNWARILLTIYAALGVMSFLSGVASSGPELGLMWSLADVAFAVTAVVYMFRPESTKYFLETKERRLRARQGPWQGR